MSQELQTGQTIDDFDVGDRIYFIDLTSIRIGTVSAISPDKLFVIAAAMDDGTDGYFSEMHLYDDAPYRIGKALNLSLLKEGSIISTLTPSGRIYAEVKEYLPEKKLVFEEKGSIFTTVRQYPGSESTIEELMIFREVEG